MMELTTKTGNVSAEILREVSKMTIPELVKFLLETRNHYQSFLIMVEIWLNYDYERLEALFDFPDLTKHWMAAETDAGMAWNQTPRHKSNLADLAKKVQAHDQKQEITLPVPSAPD